MSYLNPDLLFPNPHSLPVVLLAATILVFGFSVFTREHGSSVGTLFLLFATSVAVYFFGAGVSYAAVTEGLALRWQRIAHVGVATIPGTLLILSLSITGQLGRTRVLAWVALSTTVAFAAAVLFDDSFIAGTTRYYWGFYPSYGPTGVLYLAYFAVAAIASLWIQVFGFRRATTELYRNRMRGFLIAFGVGYLGAVDFLPSLGVELYAFGYIPVTAFVVILGTVILRYRLVDITPAVAAAQILATMPSAVLVTDTLGIVRTANQAASELFAKLEGELIDTKVRDLLPLVEDGPHLHDEPSAKHEPGLPGGHEMALLRKDGTRRTLSVSFTPLNDRRNRPIGWVYVAQDVTALKDATAALRRQALYDPLTGLPNRVLFFDRLEHLTEKLQRTGGSLAIFYVDLNTFKTVNDTHGHVAGDSVLRMCAQRMLSSTRSSDTLARIGGDEFVQICEGLENSAHAALIAEKMLEKLDQPINLGSTIMTLGGSIGIAFFPEHGQTVQQLMIAADEAMYKAKETGRSAYRIAGSDAGDDHASH